MKNQYFGDVHDLFKYDLIAFLLERLKLKNFLWVPMLTKDDAPEEGRRVKYKDGMPGTKNRELVEFLSSCIREGRRNICEIKKFFEAKGMRISIFKGDEFFEDERREEFFEELCKALPANSLILLDQDIGLEVKTMRKPEQYLKYKEARLVFERMPKSSTLAIWQFIPRIRRGVFLEKISKKIEKEVGRNPIFISSPMVSFFFLAKAEEKEEELRKALEDYASRYDLYFG